MRVIGPFLIWCLGSVVRACAYRVLCTIVLANAGTVLVVSGECEISSVVKRMASVHSYATHSLGADPGTEPRKHRGLWGGRACRAQIEKSDFIFQNKLFGANPLTSHAYRTLALALTLYYM